MLAAIALSVWCVYSVRRLALIPTTRARFVADKIELVLVAIGFLWSVFLGLDAASTLSMFRTTGVVDRIEGGRAMVSFNNPVGNRGGYDFPEFDNFSTLHAGESVLLLYEWKTAEVASRTFVFTGLGAAAGFILIAGCFFARLGSTGRSGSVTSA
jgi:hypothetical protein